MAPDRLTTSRTVHLELAGCTASLQMDYAAEQAVSPAFARFSVTDPPIDRTTPWRSWESPLAHPLWHRQPRGPLRLPNGGLAVVRPFPAVVEVHDPDHGLALWGEPNALAAGDVRAQPASTAIADWLFTRGIQVLHAACVAYDGRAVLILGPSGAGKSTAALACVAEGGTFLGDDLVAVSTSPGPIAHSLFATAKLTEATDSRLQLTNLVTLGTTPKGKRVVAIPDSIAVARSAEIVALAVLDDPTPSGSADPRRISRGVALRALASTGLKVGLGAGTTQHWLGAITALSRWVPAWRVEPSWQMDMLAEAIRRTIDPPTH